MNHPTPRTDQEAYKSIQVTIAGATATGRTVVDANFARQLERELAEKQDAIQDAADMIDKWRDRARRFSNDAMLQEERANKLERELAAANEKIADLTRPAKLNNPLHEVLTEMQLRGGNAIVNLAKYIRSPLDPERLRKAMIDHREDLERYDAKIRPIGIPATVLPPVCLEND